MFVVYFTTSDYISTTFLIANQVSKTHSLEMNFIKSEFWGHESSKIIFQMMKFEDDSPGQILKAGRESIIKSIHPDHH